MSGPPSARQVALDLLLEVTERRRPLDEALSKAQALETLEPRDRAFAHHLLLTTLRRLGEIDAVLARFMKRPLPAKRRAARAILRLGAAQSLFLNTPAHAAVSTAADLAAVHEPPSFVALINAVLRRVATEGRAVLANVDAERVNTPPWLWQVLAEAYGEPTTRLIARGHRSAPSLDLSCKAETALWAERLGGRMLPTGSVRLTDPPRVDALPGYDDGAWWVQDAAAALPARLLGPIAGQHVIEIGAAPGGKTAQLAAAGAYVRAVDRSPARLAVLRENLARLGLDADVVDADARIYQPATLADAVLLDAPCSATGTIRRHPEVPYQRSEGDIAKLVVLQDELIDAATRMLRPGGVLVFATCSLLPDEGERRIDAALERHRNFTHEPITPDLIGGLGELINARGELRTLPCHLADDGGMDGFFAARLRRQT